MDSYPNPNAIRGKTAMEGIAATMHGGVAINSAGSPASQSPTEQLRMVLVAACEHANVLQLRLHDKVGDLIGHEPQTELKDPQRQISVYSGAIGEMAESLSALVARLNDIEYQINRLERI